MYPHGIGRPWFCLQKHHDQPRQIHAERGPPGAHPRMGDEKRHGGHQGIRQKRFVCEVNFSWGWGTKGGWINWTCQNQGLGRSGVENLSPTAYRSSAPPALTLRGWERVHHHTFWVREKMSRLNRLPVNRAERTSFRV